MPGLDTLHTMFKFAACTDPQSLREARCIMESVRSENPKHWPNGLTPQHFDAGLYLVREKQASTPVGFVGFQIRRERDQGKLLKTGYYSVGILPEWRNNGFAKSAVSQLIALKSASVDRVRALVVSSNAPSLALADALGVEKLVKKADKQDKGGWAAVGGAGLLGDTAYNLHRGEQIGQKMVDLHDQVLKDPHQLLDPERSVGVLKEYGQLAQDGSKRRILGVPIGKWFQWFPPSAISGNPNQTQNRVGLMDMLRYHTGIGKLDSKTHDKIHQSVHHYDGYLNNPERTQLRELVTGKAHGQPRDVLPEFERLGVDRNFASSLLDNDVRDPLTQLNKHVLSKGGPDAKSRLGKLYYDSTQGLFTGHAKVDQLGSLSRELAQSEGSAAYGRGAGGIARASKRLVLAGALGSGAYGAYRLHKKKSSVTPEHEAAGSAAMLGGAGWLGNRARLYAPSNLITSTAGHLTPPTALMDSGAGHVTPAKAIYEALKDHPAVQSGEFQAALALRQMDKTKVNEHLAGGAKSWDPRHAADKSYQMPFRIQESTSPTSLADRPHSLITVDSGFGTHYMGAPVIREAEFSINPGGRMSFLPDIPEGNLSADKRIMFHGSPWKPAKMFTFGGRSPHASKALFDLVEHYNYHPALTESVLNTARGELKQPSDRMQIFGELSQKLRGSGDEQSAAALEQAMTSGKKIITISGSSRGDLVASRAAELQELLNQKGLHGKFQVVAMLANAKGNPEDPSHKLLAAHPNVIQVGNTGKLYGPENGSGSMYRILNASDYHWGSTGASAQAEAGMMSTPTGFVTDYTQGKKRMFDRFKQHGVVPTEAESGLLSGIDLDRWNKATIQHIRDNLHGKGQGLDAVNTAEDMFPHLQRIMQGDNYRFAERAGTNFEHAVKNKRAIADAIVEEARRLRRTTAGKMTRRFVGAGLLAAGGVAGLTHAHDRWNDPSVRLNRLENRIKEKWQNRS